MWCDVGGESMNKIECSWNAVETSERETEQKFTNRRSKCENPYMGQKPQSYLHSSLAPRNNNEIALKNFLALTVL